MPVSVIHNPVTVCLWHVWLVSICHPSLTDACPCHPLSLPVVFLQCYLSVSVIEQVCLQLPTLVSRSWVFSMHLAPSIVCLRRALPLSAPQFQMCVLVAFTNPAQFHFPPLLSMLCACGKHRACLFSAPQPSHSSRCLNYVLNLPVLCFSSCGIQ